jgi:hypothetical protein
LETLKNIGLKYGSFDSVQARRSADIEVDSFLCQMIGTVDSRLFKINGKFRLGIAIDRVEIDYVHSDLSVETTRIELLADLDMANRHGNWYWMI